MATLDELKSRFLVDDPPPAVTTMKRRVYVPPSPRPTAPKRGRQLLTWMIEEADEQMQLGARAATVKVSKTDLKLLRYLAQWIELTEVIPAAPQEPPQ